MNYKTIQNTQIDVSPICLGTMTFGTPVGEKDAIDLTHWAIGHGINFIDTANMYEGYVRVVGSAGGVAEEILGKALKGRRSDVVLATKVGMKVGAAPEDEGTSAAAIEKHLNMSLKRLATDYIDIYYLHKPDENADLLETLTALDKAIKSGKIRHYGLSNYSAKQTADLLNLADASALPRPVIHQPPYSLLKSPVEKDLLPLLEKEQIAAAPYQVLQGGLLTGKYHRGQAAPAGSRQAEKPQWLMGGKGIDDTVMTEIQKLEQKAAAQGQTLLEYTLKTTLQKPAVVSLVLGAKRIEQVESLIKAVQ